MGGLGPLLAPLRAVLGRNWGPVGGLKQFLGPLRAVLDCLNASVGGLGRSWGLCRGLGLLLGPVGGPGPLLTALGASVRDPGRLLGPLWALLGCSWGLGGRSWAALGRKVALARAGKRSSGVGPPEASEASFRLTICLHRY